MKKLILLVLMMVMAVAGGCGTTKGSSMASILNTPGGTAAAVMGGIALVALVDNTTNPTKKPVISRDSSSGETVVVAPRGEITTLVRSRGDDTVVAQGGGDGGGGGYGYPYFGGYPGSSSHSIVRSSSSDAKPTPTEATDEEWIAEKKKEFVNSGYPPSKAAVMARKAYLEEMRQKKELKGEISRAREEIYEKSIPAGENKKPEEQKKANELKEKTPPSADGGFILGPFPGDPEKPINEEKTVGKGNDSMPTGLAKRLADLTSETFTPPESPKRKMFQRDEEGNWRQVN